MSDPRQAEYDERTSLENAEALFKAEPKHYNLEPVPQRQDMSLTPFSGSVVTASRVEVNRNIPAFINRMKTLAQMAGEEYRYQFPVKSKDGTRKIVEGGSIKMANDLAREYGNTQVECVVHDLGHEWIFYARFIDRETGFTLVRPYRQRKTQASLGTKDIERQLDIAFQIGVSKAQRNVILNALQTYADAVYEEAKRSLVEKIGKNLVEYRNSLKKKCTDNNFDLKRIERVVTKKLDEWLAVDVARVVAELKSILDGMANFDDLYPPPPEGGEDKSGFTEESPKELKRKAGRPNKKNETEEPQKTKASDTQDFNKEHGATKTEKKPVLSTEEKEARVNALQQSAQNTQQKAQTVQQNEAEAQESEGSCEKCGGSMMISEETDEGEIIEYPCSRCSGS